MNIDVSHLQDLRRFPDVTLTLTTDDEPFPIIEVIPALLSEGYASDSYSAVEMLAALVEPEHRSRLMTLCGSTVSLLATRIALAQILELHAQSES
jgi:hypothetical protein